MKSCDRPGFYVEDRWFGNKFHQAKARATFLSQEYGRAVDIFYVSYSEITPLRSLVSTIHNKAPTL